MKNNDKKSGTVQITIEEFDRLREVETKFNELLSAEGCISLSIPYGWGAGESKFYINPTPEMQQLEKELQQAFERWRDNILPGRNSERRISIFDIGKKVKDVVSPF